MIFNLNSGRMLHWKAPPQLKRKASNIMEMSSYIFMTNNEVGSHGIYNLPFFIAITTFEELQCFQVI